MGRRSLTRVLASLKLKINGFKNLPTMPNEWNKPSKKIANVVFMMKTYYHMEAQRKKMTRKNDQLRCGENDDQTMMMTSLNTTVTTLFKEFGKSQLDSENGPNGTSLNVLANVFINTKSTE